jgi:prepilin-type N-terminal cleavage/methylation domain-containing protein
VVAIFNKKKFGLRQKGFSLVEILLAVSIFALIVTVFIGVLIYSQESVSLSGAMNRATFIAEEGLEATRNIKDQSFYNLVDGTYGLATSSSKWIFSGSSDRVDIFTRRVTVSTVDSSTKKIVSTVTWQKNPQRTGSVSLSSYLTNWTAGSDWYNVNYPYRKKLTIDKTLVSGTSNLSSFPVLIAYTDADLKTTANGGHVSTTTAYDVIFTSSNGTTKLNHEIESYSSSTGAIAMWVSVTTVSTSTDTDLYIYYGNSSATSSPENIAGVWDSNYKVVSHLSDSTNTSSVKDSTSNANNGTKRGAAEPAVTTSGKVNNAQTFDGSNDRINFASASTVDSLFASGGTVEAWIYPTGWGEGNYGRIADKKGSGSGWGFYVNNSDVSGGLSFYYDTTLGFFAWYLQWNTGNSTISLNNWNHVAVTFNSGSTSNNPIMYINGASKTISESGDGYSAFSSETSQDLNVGNRPAEDRTFAGRIDEFRASKTTRSAGWLATEYNNMANQGTGSGKFIKTLGAEENR